MDPLHALTAGVASLSLSSNIAHQQVASAQAMSHVASSLFMLQRMQQAGLLNARYEANEARLGPIPPPTNESRQRYKLQQESELECKFFEGVKGKAYTLHVPYLNLMQRMKEAREWGFSPINEIYIPGSGASRIAGPMWYRLDLQTICNNELSDLLPIANVLDLSHIDDADDLDTQFSAEGAALLASSVHYLSVHPEALFIMDLIEQHHRQLKFTIEYENGKRRHEQGFYGFLTCMSNRQMRKGIHSVQIQSQTIPWMQKVTLSMQEVGEIWQKLEASGFFYSLKDQNWGAVDEVVLNLALDYIFKMTFEGVIQFFHEEARAFTHYHALYRECQKGVLRDWNRFTCKDTRGIHQDILFMRTTTTPKKRIAFQEMQIDMMPALCGRTHELSIKTSWQAIIDKAFRLTRWLDLTFADQKDWALFWFLVAKRYVSVLPETQTILQTRFLDFCKRKGDNTAAFCKAILEMLDGRSKQDKTLNFAFIFNSLSALSESEFSSENIANIWEPLKDIFYDSSLDPSWKLIADALLDHSVNYRSLTTLLKKLAYDLLSQPVDTPDCTRFLAFITEHNGKMAVQFEMAGFTFLFPHDLVNDLNAFESCRNNLRLQLIARTLYPESTSVHSLLTLLPESTLDATTERLVASEMRNMGLCKRDEESLISSIHHPQNFIETLLSVSDERLNSIGLALWKKSSSQDNVGLIIRLAKVRFHSVQLIVRTVSKEEQQKLFSTLFEEAIKEKNQGKFLQLIYSLCELCDDDTHVCRAALTLFQRGEREKAIDLIYIASDGKSDSLLAQFSREYRQNTMQQETLVALACRQDEIYNQLFFLAAQAMQKRSQRNVDESTLVFVAKSDTLQAARSAMQEVVARELTSSPMMIWMSYVELQEGKAAFDAYQAGFDLNIWNYLVTSQYPHFYGNLITKLYRSNDPSLFLEAEKLETVANGYVIGHVDPKAKADAKKNHLEYRIQNAVEETLPEVLREALGLNEKDKTRTLLVKWLSKKNLIACLEVLQQSGSRDYTLWLLAFEKASKEANAKQKKRAVDLAKEAIADTAAITTIQEAMCWCDFEEYYLQLKNSPVYPTLEAMQNGEHALCTKFTSDNFRQMRLARHLLRVLRSESSPSPQMKAARDSLDGFLQPRRSDRKELDLAYVRLMLQSDDADCFLSAALRLQTLTKEEIAKEHCELITLITVRAHKFEWPRPEAIHTCLIALSLHYQAHLMLLQDPFYLIMSLTYLPPHLYFKIAAEMTLSRIKREGALRDVQGAEEVQLLNRFVLSLIESFDPQLLDFAALIIDNFAAIHDHRRALAKTRQIMKYVAAVPLQKAIQCVFDLMHNLFKINYLRDSNQIVTPHKDHKLWVEQRIETVPINRLSMEEIVCQAVIGYMGYLTDTFNLARHYPISLVEDYLVKVLNKELPNDEILAFDPLLDFCKIGKMLLIVPTADEKTKKALFCCAYSMLLQAMRVRIIPKTEVISFLEDFILCKDVSESASLFHHYLCHTLLNTAETLHLFKDCLPEQKFLLTVAVTAMIPQIKGVSEEKRKESITRAVKYLMKRADLFSRQKAILLITNAIDKKIAFDDEQRLQWGLAFAATLKSKVSFNESEIDSLLKCVQFCKGAKGDLLTLLQKASQQETPRQAELKQLHVKLSSA